LIPQENVKDLKEIPDQILKDLHIEPVTIMEEVLKHALVAPEQLAPKPDSCDEEKTQIYEPKEEPNVVTDRIC
jgi:ATP-dependent Lon protease